MRLQLKNGDTAVEGRGSGGQTLFSVPSPVKVPSAKYTLKLLQLGTEREAIFLEGALTQDIP